MDNWKDSVMTVLEARKYLYQVFQTVLGADPSKAILDLLSDDLTAQALEIFADDGLPALGRAAAFFQPFQDNQGELLERLKREYTRLFIGPDKLLAPPWESVYVTKRRLLFQASTLSVRSVYARHGFLPKNYPHVADDHLALELDFMARLSGRAVSCFDEGDMENVRAGMVDQMEFLDEHLLKWLPMYAEAMDQEEDSILYVELAHILLEFIRADRGAAGEILETLQQEDQAIPHA